ncbi:ComEC/Rec2 family competence protein [Pseudactinotalea sp. Z1739]|uniref:ComEC/Rec2 family competence protein n=1 Tax=Pseudactinotalea sp. Z1739 TaxID=3413028 RepID=UPI003C7AE1E9
MSSASSAWMDRAPVDLRLLPGALVTWVGCWWVLGQQPLAGAVLSGLLLLMSLLCGVRLSRSRPGRHRRERRDRVTATVLLTGVVAGSVLGVATVRATERSAVITGHPAEVTAIVQPTAEPQRLASERSERYRVPARLFGVLHDAERARDLPVLLLTDAGWRDVPVGTTWWVRARVVPTGAGDSAAALLVVTAGAHQHGPAAWHHRAVNRLRSGLVSVSDGLAPQARGLVPGIALGDTRAMPPVLGEDLRTVSLTHITAVSGMHVAIVLGSVVLCLWWAPVWVRAGVGGVVLLGFVALVYPSGSVLRAGTMGAVLLLGLATGRPRASIPALLATVIVLLGLDPWLSRDFGFTLSVVATSGLLALAAPIARRLGGVCPPQVAMAAAVPAAAQLVCAPVILFLAPGLPTHGVLANVLATPAVPPATLLGVLATLCQPFWPAGAQSLAQAAAWFTAWIATVATTTAGLPLATLPWPEGTGGAVLVSAGLLAATLWWRTRGR